MRRATWNGSHALLCGFLIFAFVAVALGLRSWAVAPLLILPLGALFIDVALPKMVVLVATWVVRAAALGAALGGLIMALYPVISEAVIFGVTSALGHLLVLLAGVLLLARTAPSVTILPAAFGALIAAFIPPEAAWMRVAAGLALACLVAWLAGRDDERGSAVAVRPLPLAIFIVMAGSITAGVAFLLPWAQPRVEVMIAEAAFSDLQASTGVATASRLGDVEKLSRSKRVALRFYSDAATDLRVRVFTRFDGKSWQADPRVGPRLVGAPDSAGVWPTFDGAPGDVLALPGFAVTPNLRAARVVVPSAQTGVMPAPAHSMAVKVEDVDVDTTPSGILLPSARASIYGLLFAPEDVAEPPPGEEMLALPAKIDPRLRELAATLAAADASPQQRADRVAAWFQSGYRYTLEVGAFQTPDPVAEFVFDKKQGYCEYFATATTLLLRLSGVPARYVTGYAVRSFQWSAGHYVVRDSDAHAWSEAYLPGRGWVEVDATPSADYAALHGDLESAGVIARLQAAWDDIAAFVRQGGMRGVARVLLQYKSVLIGVALAFLAFRFRKRLGRPSIKAGAPEVVTTSATLSPELRSLLGRVDGLCAARGRPRPVSRAPLEHVSDRAVALGDEERSVCLAAVGLLYAQAYGGQSVSVADVAKTAAALAAFAPSARVTAS